MPRSTGVKGATLLIPQFQPPQLKSQLGESIQKEFQIMIMKKYFGKNKKIKVVNFINFVLIFKNS